MNNRPDYSTRYTIRLLVSYLGCTLLGGCASAVTFSGAPVLASPSQTPIAMANPTVLGLSAENRAAIAVPSEVIAANPSKDLPLQKDMPYAAARQLLLQEGWRPHPQVKPNLRDSTVKALFDGGYPEIEDCSGTGEGPCRFAWSNAKGEVLMVVGITGGRKGRFVKTWWIEPLTTPSPASSAVPPITNGRYWLGGTDQGLEVQGAQYRYYTEGGEQPWRPITDLKAIQSGVVFDGKNYWCLSSLAPKTGATACSATGWMTTTTPTNLPFVGMRRFNFLGGSGMNMESWGRIR